MNESWVVSVRTSLPYFCKRADKLQLSVGAFDCFEKAKSAFREKIKEFAFSENAMFDGDGKITSLYNFNDMNAWNEDEERFENLLYLIESSLTRAFSGEDWIIDAPDGTYDDGMIAIEVKNGAVRFYGEGNGPRNGYDPILKTNIFSMEKEQDYYLYIADLFGQRGGTAELYMDLKRATIE